MTLAQTLHISRISCTIGRVVAEKVAKKEVKKAATKKAAQKELGKVDKDVTKITGKSLETDPLVLEKPVAIAEN